MKQLFKSLLLALAILPVAACQAGDQQPTFKAGEHYEVLPQPVPTADPGRVEVAEVFWYGCGHCYSFESLLKPWKKALPEYVQFVAVPAVWHPDMALHAQAYYTARALKVQDTMHDRIFEAMNLKHQKLKGEAEIAELFVSNGVDQAQFNKVFNSFGVKQSVKMAESRQRAYRVKGTPELIVNGKYRIAARLAGSQEKMLEVANYLIEKEHQALQQQ